MKQYYYMRSIFIGLLLLLACLPSAEAACDTTVCGVGGTCQDPNTANTTCTSCGTLANLTSYLYPTNTTCLTNCPSDSWKNTGAGTCDLCDASCNGCSGSIITCLTCAGTYFRKIGSQECTNNCGTGFYGDSNTNHCTACPDGCATCSMPSTSVQCDSCGTVGGVQYYHSNSNTSCVSICPSGEYGDGSTFACTACSSPCATCQTTGSTCLSCSTGSLIYNTNECIPTCPGGQYDPGSNFCQLCDSNCATCQTISTNCLTCGVSGGEQTYLHSDAKCYATCPNGFFGQYTGGAYVCSACDASCNGCSLTNINCLHCASSSYFRKIGSNQCTNNCGTGYFGDTSTGLCTVCTVGCSACAYGTPVTCSACQPVSGVTYYLNGNACVSTCPDTAGGLPQYGDDVSGNCATCDSTCATCSGGNANNCLTCVSAKYLAFGLGTCLSACPNGQYFPNGTQTCYECNVNCLTCSGTSTTCGSCGTSVNGLTLFLYSSTNECLSACPGNTYGNTGTNTCDPCEGTCATCSGPLATNCLTCSSGSFDSATGTCTGTCGTGRYSSNNVCYDCPSHCSACSSSTVCTQCQHVLGVNYFLNSSSCLVNCPSGTYADTGSLTCVACTAPCATCSGSSTHCLTCATGNLIHGSNTCGSCPNGQYLDATTGVCQLCSSQCLTCSGASTTCLTCGLSVNGLNLFLYTDAKCYQTCPDQFYGNLGNHQCTACDGSCNKCTLSATNCVTCAGGNYRQIGSNACGACASGYYGDTSTSLCTICPVGCLTCTSATVCTACKQVAGVTHYLYNNQCLEVCPTTTFKDSVGPACTACTAPCQTCSSSATTCLTCTAGNVLHFGTTTCSGTCPDGQYDSGSRTCLQCSTYCATCTTNSSNCQSCRTLGGVGYYLSGSSCIISCPVGYFQNTGNLQCTQCDLACASCTGALKTSCSQCQNDGANDYYLEYGTTTCSLNCPSNQYKDLGNFQCLLCQSSCATCVTSSSNCQTCGFSTAIGADLFLSGSQCLLTCPSGKWGDVGSHQCTTCHVGCSVCTDGTLNTCSSCKNDTSTQYYKEIGATVCGTTCPAGQYISASVANECQPCSSTCITCSGTAQNCSTTSCPANLYYLNNSCLSACPTGYYADASRQCQTCATGCFSCTAAGANACDKCLTVSSTPYFFKAVTTCSQTCDSGYYGNSTTNLCVACPGPCLTCTSQTACQSCQSVNGVGYYLSSSTCTIQCPLGQYGRVSDYTCQTCATGCLACFQAALTQCYNCTGSHFLEYGTNTCATTCPSGQYSNTTSNKCLLCSASCATCVTTATNCLTCGLSNAGVHLFKSGTSCLAVCPDSFWGNSGTNTCDACSPGCLTCTAFGTTYCMTCGNVSTTQYYKTIGETICDTVCPGGQFILSTIPNDCQPCSSSCVTCSVSAQNCTSNNCSANFFYLNNSCLSSCPNGYYADLNLRQCIACTAGCALCTTSGRSSCSQCQADGATNYFLQLNVLTTCATGCNPGEYEDTVNMRCVACNPACATCTDYSTCLTCQSVNGIAYFKDGSTCTVSCPSTHYGEVGTYTCTLCDTNCLTCFGPTIQNCNSCTNSHYLIYGTTICSATCPNGQYSNTTSAQCLLCSSECLTCSSNSTHCLSCGHSPSGLVLYLQNNRCIFNCAVGFYQDVNTNLCTACDPACVACLDGTKNYCSSCANDAGTQYYLIIGTTICSTTCPVGQYIDAAYSNTCQPCDANCVGCSVSPTNCTQDHGCNANLFYNNATNSCVLTCPDGTYPDSVTKFCQNCDSSCSLCYGSVSTKCTRCASGFFKEINKDSCVSACATGQYGQASTLLCQTCNSACAVCTNTATNCSQCQSVNGVAYFLEGQACTISCALGTFGQVSNLQCTGCSGNCISCFGGAVTQCHNCSGGFFLQYGTSSCLATCPNGQYQNSTDNTCMLCSGECATCSGSASNCLSCGFSQYGFNLFLSGSQCLLTCPISFWANTGTHTCDGCSPGCLTCTNIGTNNCQSCTNVTSTQYYKHIGATTCDTTCPAGQYIDAAYPNDCRPCASNCITCLGTADHCTNTNCSVNFLFLNNSCLSTCPTNYYYADTTARLCSSCASGCLKCFGSLTSQCTECDLAGGNQYYLQRGTTTCNTVCNSGEYPQISNKTCVLCSSVCATCTSPSVCQSCQSVNGIAYYLEGSSCTVNCPSTKYGNVNTLTCDVCANGCLTCFGGTTSECNSCTIHSSQQYYLQYNTKICATTCPNGQFQSAPTAQCLLCSGQCLTCSGTASNCLTCGFSQYGFNLYLHGTQCLLNCPDNYFANSITFTCDQCTPGCQLCTTSGLSSCSQCNNDTSTIYYKQIGANICGTTCPNGQFISAAVPNLCQPCSSTCITCSVIAENCTNTNCSINYFYLNNSCLSTCPEGYYPDSALRQCIQCTSGCQACYGSGLAACTKCSAPGGNQYYKRIGIDTCSLTCNPGEYGYSLTKACTACNVVCATCTSASVCNSCQARHGVAYYLSNNQCIFECPFGQYGNLTDFTCYTCPPGCLSCFGGASTSCYNCTAVGGTNYFLHYGTNFCSTSCPNGQFENVTSSKCLLCDSNCLTCVTNATNCLSCGFSSIGASLFLYQSGCLLTCPDGYFANTTSNTCDACHQGCAICTGPSSQQCSACRTSLGGTVYYKQVSNNNCSTTCPTGQLISGTVPNTCSTCDPGCSACAGLSTTCLVGQCNTNYFYYTANSSCLLSCPNNFYPNTTTQYCTQCDPGCQLCFASGTTSCTSCQVTTGGVSFYKVIDINTCSPTCPPGQYPYDLLLACQYCSTTCLTCNTSALDCQTCNNVSGVAYYQHSNQCLSICPNGYYGQTSNNTCVGCFGGCSLCFAGNDFSCTQCQNFNSNIYYLVYGSTNCSLTCPDGQYSVDLSNQCLVCDANCHTCNIAATNCTSCLLTSTGIRLFLQNFICVQACATSTYANTTDNKCYDCNVGCHTCTGPSLYQCQACRDHTLGNGTVESYYLNIGNSICSLACPVGQYIRAGYPNACQACAVQCIGCSVSSTNCTEIHMCTIGYFFYRATNSCIATCPGGYYANTTTSYCEVCPGGCALCTAGNLNSCQQCKLDPSTSTAYYKQIYMESCVTNCLDGQYEVLSDFSCQPCHTSCVLCQANSTACQQCKNVSGINYFYYANQCLLNCPNGYYGAGANNTCMVCNPACALCSGPTTNECFTCQPDTTSMPTVYYYLQFATTYCVTTCPYGQYKVNSSWTCQNCNINCATCEGTSTNCLTCTYVNTINIVYLYQSACVVTCPSGFWPNSTNSLDHQCSVCHSYCTICTGPANTQCTSCGNISLPSFVMYYKDHNSSTCNPTCPDGQYIDALINNLCVPCHAWCLLCHTSSTNCSKCAVGYFYYQPNNTCTNQCPSGYYNDPVITANNYVCTICDSACLTCTGGGQTSCQTCQNVTVNGSVVYYFREVTLHHCVTTCSVGYFGNTGNNNCDPCQTGCVSCQFNASYCYSCTNGGGTTYYKPQTSNSCVTICPNGQYGNATDYACHDCIYYTLQGTCVLTCPAGFFPQVNNSKTICQDCNDPSAVGNPCNRSYTFSVQTTVINSGNNMQHKIYLPNGLSSNVTAADLMNNLSVVISQPSRRLLQSGKSVEEIKDIVQRSLYSGRLLVVNTPLTVYDLTLSPDRSVIYITTNYVTADFSVASVVVDFPANALVSADGLLYQSTTASFPLSDPIFQQSYYEVFSKSINLGIEGIVFILLSMVLLIFQLIIANRKGYHQIMAFIMFLQVIGISRIRQYPIDFNIYSVLLGYSYFELSFIPNGFAYIFPPGYRENSLDPVAFAVSSHNAVLNLGSIIQVFVFLQLVMMVYYICKNDKPQHLARMKLYQQTLVVLFMVVILYMSSLAMISLSLNSITDLAAQYLGSIGLALLLLIFYAIYILVWVRPYRLFQLYKINNLFRVVGLAVLPINRYAGLIVIDIAELIFFMIDMVLYRSQKLNTKAYVCERIFIMIAINASVFATTSLSLLIVAGLSIAAIFAIKIYYTVITVKEFIDQSKMQGASELDVSDVVNVSVKDKEEPISVHMDNNSMTGKLNQSDNFIYNQSLQIDKFDQMPSRNQLIKFPKELSSIRDGIDDQEEKKIQDQRESQESNQQMIVYLDPDDYKEETKKRQEIKQAPMPAPKPASRLGSQRKDRKRNLKVDGMKTTAGFFPRDRGNYNGEQGIEVIKVEPNREDREENNSDLVSDSSDGGGWLAQNDERNINRARKNQLVWKIMEEDPFEKGEKGEKDDQDL